MKVGCKLTFIQQVQNRVFKGGKVTEGLFLNPSVTFLLAAPLFVLPLAFQPVTHNCLNPALIRNTIETSFSLKGFQQISLNFYTDQFQHGLFEGHIDDSKILKISNNLPGR